MLNSIHCMYPIKQTTLICCYGAETISALKKLNVKKIAALSHITDVPKLSALDITG